MGDNVRIDISDRVMEITFDRVAKKNALTGAMYGAAADGFGQASGDDAIRCVLITGGDEVFTAGNDIGDFLSGPGDMSDRQSGRLRTRSRAARTRSTRARSSTACPRRSSASAADTCRLRRSGKTSCRTVRAVW